VIRRFTLTALALFCAASLLAAPSTDKKKEERKPGTYDSKAFSGLTFRSIGPAVTSGRVSEIAIHPSDRATWYVAVASGGVWKTVNSGTTWTPIFDGEVSYSIGTVVIDPKDPLVVWVGTGENNSQRSVAYGDGVYKSTDGGATWKNVGLEKSEHIGKIVIDPRNSNVVYVAAQGPLWNSGGDRGLYKTTDGGKSWKKVLEISPETGVSDLIYDPRNPDVLYATAYQRRRHVWTLINGGPESAIYKSIDAGATWNKVNTGLPEVHLGRIGLGISPADPDKIYALVEAADGKSGFFRSTNAGASWEKRSDYKSSSPQYYQEIIVDPKDADRVYSMDTWMMVTEDGGKSFVKVGEKWKHVDNHALIIDERDTDHLIAGCDGGIYESYDRGATWRFIPNFPIAQFYKLTVDNDVPFYNVYGGTQDNNTLGGPSRTANEHGIRNSDWFVTVGGDGFQPRVDPEDPNIVYSQAQYGELVRFDRRSGEYVDIKPAAAPGEAPLRFNWDSPLIISPHSNKRIYYAAQRLFRSDDRGDSWSAVSPDLTRQTDRNKLKVMGRVWSADAVAKNASTSLYGNIVSLSESPLKENLLYVGTDDGLIQVSEDGTNWRKIERFAGIPEVSYVSDVEASQHAADVVYASFDNHKMGDFKPYLLRSNDRGKTWTSIAGDLPQRGTVYAIAEDHVDPKMIFVGTEFGIFFTSDGGAKWIQLKGGMPPIAVRDIAIQKRENDLVLATFGRGFYILDDYTPLRKTTASTLQNDAVLYPLEKAVWAYHPSTPLGLKGKSMLGDDFYTGENPPFGAVFTYYLKEELKSRRKSRLEAESNLEKEGKDIGYPTWEDLRRELREAEPAVVLTVSDEEGNVVRRFTGPAKAGFHRVAWDLRYPPVQPTSLEPPKDDNPWDPVPQGMMAATGNYTVSLAKYVDGKFTPLGEPQKFTVRPLGLARIPDQEARASADFERKVSSLQRAVLGATSALEDAQHRVDLLQKAVLDTPGADPAIAASLLAVEDRLKNLDEKLTGDPVVARYNEPVPSAITDYIQRIIDGQWGNSAAVTKTQRDAYTNAATAFAPVLDELRGIIEGDLRRIEQQMEAAGAPWTPGRLPTWKSE
jgi:photosystem II stability/assembly factor-like uncharacterized protein